MAPPHAAKQTLVRVHRPRSCRKTVAQRVCSLICHGYGLRAIAARPDMPTVDTLKNWIEKDPAFRAEYDAARQFQSEVFADDVVALANAVAEFDVAGVKLRIDALKWRSSVLRKDGDKGGLDRAAFDAEMIARLEAGLKRADGIEPSGAECATTAEESEEEDEEDGGPEAAGSGFSPRPEEGE